MVDLVPVEHDPFSDPPTHLVPVDHDPFAQGPAQAPLVQDPLVQDPLVHDPLVHDQFLFGPIAKPGQAIAPQNLYGDLSSIPGRVVKFAGDATGVNDALRA
jgi:hypothetical protein